MNLDAFTEAYVECALWSSTDGGEPLDAHHGPKDLSPECLATMVADCKKFQKENRPAIATWVGVCPADEQAGHDFWLTRNSHGAGFWDGDWGEEYGNRLTEAAKAFGECSLYLGDGGLIYC